MILDRYLEKIKVKSKHDLTPSERAQYDIWERVLTSELRIEDIEKSIRAESQRLGDEWLEEESKNPFNFLFHWKKEVEIKARLKNYNALLKLITSKDKEKEKLISHIQKLINK